MNYSLAFTNTYKTFRRSTCKLEITKINIEKIWRRIYLAELSVHRQSLRLTLNLNAAARHGLNQISGNDVLFEGHYLLNVFRLARFHISEHFILKALVFFFYIREVHVVNALKELFHCSAKVNLMLVIVETKNMNLFGKVVKNYIEMAGNKKTFWNLKFILLFKKADVVAVLCKLIAQVAESRSRQRQLT